MPYHTSPHHTLNEHTPAVREKGDSPIVTKTAALKELHLTPAAAAKLEHEAAEETTNSNYAKGDPVSPRVLHPGLGTGFTL
jgi:hypothetical protein